MAQDKLNRLEMLGAFALLLLAPPPATQPTTQATVGQPGSGSTAAQPAKAVPRKKPSTIAILKDTFRAFSDDRTLAVSAGATFYGLLALFPALASFVSIFGLFVDSTKIGGQIDGLSGFLPGGALDIIREQIARITAKGGAALSGAFLLGLATSLWSANAGMKAMFDALNISYGLKEKRGFFKLNAIALGFTLASLVTVALAAGLLVILPPLLQRFGSSEVTTLILKIGRWPVLLAVLSVAIALLYRFGPSPQEQHWRWLTPGSLVATIAWVLVSAGFSYYASHFGSYDATYGSLGAAIGLMTWIWLSITVILLGAELNAQIDKSTDDKKAEAASPRA